MKFGKVQGVNKDISRVVLGTMIISAQEKERSYALLDAAYESGINAFDTAFVYAGGHSERCLGPWINEHGLREKVVVIDKGCHPNAEGVRVTPEALDADLREALSRLQFDYIDIYMLHRDDPSRPVGPIVEAFNEHLRAGRIRAFGGSNWRHERISQANEYARQHGLVPFTVSSPNYGLADQVDDPWGPGSISISGPRNTIARAWYAKQQMAIFAYSSLGRGLFSGRITRENCRETADAACLKAYCHDVNFQRLDRVRELAQKKRVTVPQIALAFVLSQPLNVFALVGAASREECQANVAALNLKLTPAELAWLDLQRPEPT
jgi:aryl-alcohol dehydrogenase-like predicted oxidoreductase